MQRKPSHFLILGSIALVLHVWALTLNLKLQPDDIKNSAPEDKLSLLLQIRKPPSPIPSVAPDTLDTQELKESPIKPVDSIITKLATDHRTPQVVSTKRGLQAFVADLVNEELKDPRRLESFKNTFGNSSNSLPSGIQIEEQAGGNISVQTKMFGKAVCYDFAADGDPPLAFFKDCPENDIKLEISRWT